MPIVVVVDNGQAPTTMGVVEEDCYNRNRIYTVYGRIDDRTVPLASEFFLIRYGIRSSCNRQHAVAIRPYTVYGTVYSPTGDMVLLPWVPVELKLHLVVEICFSSTQIIAVLLWNLTRCILEGLYCMHVKFLRFTVLVIHCGMVTGNKGH